MSRVHTWCLAEFQAPVSPYQGGLWGGEGRRAPGSSLQPPMLWAWFLSLLLFTVQSPEEAARIPSGF